MPSNEVFLDASALIALINRSDALHAKAVALYEQFQAARARLVSSDWVLAEFLSGAARPSLRNVASQFVSAVRKSARMTVIEASRSDWDRAFAFYSSHADKRWSLIDCSSMLICQDRGIRRVFTYDDHFRQFGLEVLLRQ